MAQILTAIYLFAMLAAGWRLFGVDWSRGAKLSTAVTLIARSRCCCWFRHCCTLAGPLAT